MTIETTTITGLHHLVLFCTDTERSRAWYERAGFEYLRGYEGMHWFRLGQAEVMLHPTSETPAGAIPSLHAAVTDVDACFARARAAGLVPHDHQQPGVTLEGPVTRPWGDREFELDDPDGWRWALTEVRR
jgi:catechol 2,3-dioxygenase-like lactoylglutathione lyase family enzyme